MKPLSFTSDHSLLLLGVVWSLLRGYTGSGTSTPNPESIVTNATEIVTTTTLQTTLMTTPSTTKPPPANAEGFKSVGQNETSVTLQWKKVENILTYVLVSSDGEKTVTAEMGNEPVTHVTSGLTNGTKYNFTLFTVSENVRSSGVSISAATAPRNAADFKSVVQTETSVTLQWNKVENILTYTLVSSKGEISVTASEGNQQVTHTISGLSSGTKYDLSLFTVFETVRSSGVNLTAVTAPRNAAEFQSVGQNETSVTLQWNKVNGSLTYTLLSIKGEISVTALEIDQQVTHTISDLSSGTKYDISLFTVFENVSSSGVNLTAVTVPLNAGQFQSVGQNETSVTLQWNKVNGSLTYTLVSIKGEISVTALEIDQQVTHTISDLSSGTKYDISLFTVFETVRSSGVNLTVVTAPRNAAEFQSVGQNETSVTLQWNKVNGSLTYTLLSIKGEISVTALEIDQQVTHTISDLSSGTKYDISLFTVFENVSSSGVNLTAVTVPLNAGQFQSVGQTETSVTLQWNKVNGSLRYTLVSIKGEISVTASEGDQQVTHTISDLSSGTKYDFSLFTVFETISSSGVNLTAVTAPRNAAEFKSVGQNETSVTLQWNKVNGSLTYTLVSIKGEISVTASEENQQVTHTISDLSSGTKYDISLFTVFENVSSSGVNLTAVTVPLNAGQFQSVGQNETSVTLQWNKVNGSLTYTLVSSKGEISVTASERDQQVTHTISDLRSGTKNDISLFTVFETVRSSGVNLTAVTVPPAVSLVNVTERSVTSLALKWQNVDKDWSYSLQINGIDVTVTPELSSNVVSYSVTSLQPGTEYLFSVITLFSRLNSTAYEGFTVTAIDCASVAWHVTNSSIQGMVPGLFSKATANETHVSPAGGDVSFTGLYPGATYEVSLVYESNSTLFEQCRHSLIVLPPSLNAHCEYSENGYSILIVWDKPDGVWTEVEVNVSGQTHMVPQNGEQHTKISGFSPARTYVVSLDSLSGYARSYEPLVFLCSTDPRGVIAGSVLGVLLLIALVCMVLFILLKRPDLIRKHQFRSGSKLSRKSYRTISVAEFPGHFFHLSEDDNKGFSEEYEHLQLVGTEQSKKAADQPENRKKNRFNNVLSYNWSRVKLTASKSKGTSDYINANYMPGFNSKTEYIATQGPLPSTATDFWRMIWEQKVKGIVMVTNCVELGRTKCDQYWPADRKPRLHGEVLITVRSEHREPHWTLREFSVKNRNMSEERTVRHFHFTAWPDHGVPQGTKDLIQFRGLVRRHIEREGTGAPTVVHCSAGVGRTGTIIALDVLLQQLDQNKAVSINGFVHKMRLSRPHMVQTESQYVFLHQCIMDCLPQQEMTEEAIYENSEMIYVNATALKEFH
ncbi:receptor-type tyrosine-protein phosphatase H-like isoform X1 [Hippoglossus hippoglossus]|uniref:receptor-type tyrosine-protein phosphatase H-like isoform X1 n=1 Tax=Hippoglossus hippoglossus TaxID=8267 RepID=UPI00148CC639|nr:receptor-type tyrosine-protein phosphatase H-like isoform X1 [Hippoglossus hippoglossus]XP_034427242.1 receptor-type tyrosine-protein phosphatase H-like isoform X1 [Hippoglossus hippoglossus]